MIYHALRRSIRTVIGLLLSRQDAPHGSDQWTDRFRPINALIAISVLIGRAINGLITLISVLIGRAINGLIAINALIAFLIRGLIGRSQQHDDRAVIGDPAILVERT